MNGSYPEDNNKLDIIGHLEEFRRRIFIVISIIFVCTIFCFLNGEFILKIIKIPSDPYLKDLIFLSPVEAFSAQVKTSLLFGFFMSFPFVLFQAWAYFSPAISPRSRKNAVKWLFLAFFLFISGICFSYFIAIPAALRFLIEFGSQIAVPQISIGKYISFVSALILTGGVVFEIPVLMIFSADAGLLSTKQMKEKRHLAIIAILVFSAVITPTQDIFNMLIFSIPMIILFELGLILSKFVENNN